MFLLRVWNLVFHQKREIFAGKRTGLDKDEAIRVGYNKKAFYSSYLLLNINKEKKLK